LSGLNEQEANEVLAALLEVGVGAEKQKLKEDLSITIDDNEVAKSLNALSARGLPKRRLNRMGDVFQKDSMISSPIEEKARYLYALSQELESTLSLIDGVINARVHIVLPDRISIGEPVMPASAAVFIKHNGLIQTQGLADKVRKIISGSVPALAQNDKEKITVELFQSQEIKVQTSFDHVFGVVVEKGSSHKLQTIMYVLFASNLVTFLGLLYSTFYRRLFNSSDENLEKRNISYFLKQIANRFRGNR